MSTEEESPKVTERVSLVESGWMAETIFARFQSPQLQFAEYRNGKVRITPQLVLDDWQVDPPLDYTDLIRKGFVLLPPNIAPYGSQERLLAEMTAFVNRYADIQPFEAEVGVHYALMTWAYDRFNVLPYLRWLGEAEGGKTRKLQTVGSLCYKCICAGGSTTASPLFRLLEDFNGTFMFDEADFRNSDLWVDIIKILNNGYMRGFPVLRSEKVGNRYIPTAYDVFGPKIIATRRRFEDHALETRCLTFLTEEKKIRHDIPRSLPDKFYEEAQALRAKLLMWRFENYRSIQPDESKLLDTKPRLAQLGTPLYSVSKDEDFRSRLVEFLTQTEREQTLEKPQAAIVEAIRRLSQSSGTLAIKDVARAAGDVAQELDIEGSLTPKAVGGYVRSMGFRPHRTMHGYIFSVDKRRLDELVEKYANERA